MIYLSVPDAVLARWLPSGWKAVPFDAGPGKGANVTLNLSEQLLATDAEGKASSEGRGHGLTFSAHVLGPASPAPEAMVLFGMTDGDDAPGPYGVHRSATIEFKQAVDETARRTVREQWKAVDRAGDQLDIRLAVSPAPATMASTRQRTRSSNNPDFSREYRVTSVSEATRALTGEPLARRSAKGVPALLWAKDGQVVSIVSVPVYHREIWLQESIKP